MIYFKNLTVQCFNHIYSAEYGTNAKFPHPHTLCHRTHFRHNTTLKNRKVPETGEKKKKKKDTQVAIN